MNPLRTLFDDLREKRLLPVVVLLVAAAVAIPVVIGGGGGDAGGAVDAAAVVPLPAPAADAQPAVELVGPPAVRSRPGKVRDPFRRATAAKASAAGAQPSSGSQDGAKSSSGSASGSSKSGATKSAAPASKPAPTASKAARTVYETVANFKGANHDYFHALEIRDVFGDPANPALLYAGVADGGEYAIFVLGPQATANDEDGACVVADPCRAIGLRKGEKLRVSVAFPGGATRNYTLQVLNLRRVVKSTEASAKAYRRDFDKLGREVHATISKDVATAATLRQLRYSRRSGTVSLVAAP